MSNQLAAMLRFKNISKVRDLLKGQKMMKMKSSLGLLALVVFAVSILPVTMQAQDEEAKGGDWKGVTILYTTDIKGKIDPCG